MNSMVDDSSRVTYESSIDNSLTITVTPMRFKNPYVSYPLHLIVIAMAIAVSWYLIDGFIGSIGQTHILMLFIYVPIVLAFSAFPVFLIVLLLWSLLGKFVVRVSEYQITSDWKLLGIGPSATYDAARIRQLQIVPMGSKDEQARRRDYGYESLNVYRLTIDYEGQQRSLFPQFANLHGKTASDVLATILERYPQYAS